MRAIAAILLFPFIASAASFSGAAALEFARHAVSFGPRPPGSEANRKLEAYIVSQLKLDGCEVSEDPFTAQTPNGAIAMKNVIAKFPGKSGRAIVITGHFDTKLFPGRRFVGANDGGSSTGLLLELGEQCARLTSRIVFCCCLSARSFSGVRRPMPRRSTSSGVTRASMKTFASAAVLAAASQPSMS